VTRWPSYSDCGLATFQRKIHSRPKRQRRDSTRFSSRGGLPTGRSWRV